MKAMLAMCGKDLRLLVRDRMGFFFAVFFPLIMAVFFGTIFASGGGKSDGEGVKKIGVLVVDSDKTPASEKFVRQLTEAPEFRVTVETALDAATTKIRKGEGGVAAVHIPKGYGEASERMFWGDPPVLEVHTDPSRKAEIGMFEGLLTKYAFMRMQEMFSNPGKFIPSTQDALAQLKTNQEMDPQAKSALQTFLPNLQQFLGSMPADLQAGSGGGGGLGSWEPVKIESKPVQAEKRVLPPSGYAITFPQGIIWGVIGCALAIGLSLVIERSHGTFVRLRMAPVPRWGVLGGKALTCMVLITGMSAMLMAIGQLPVFNVRPSSPLMLVLAVFSTAVCFTGLMMIVAALGKTESSAAGLGWGIMMIFSMLGGGMFPLFFMPEWLQSVSSISPVKWSIVAIEGGIWRGFTLAEMLKPCGILLGVGVVSFIIGTAVLRRTERA